MHLHVIISINIWSVSLKDIQLLYYRLFSVNNIAQHLSVYNKLLILD